MSDAEAIAEGFCSAEYRSRGISVDVTNIRTSGQLLEALNDELDPIIKEHSATLRTLVVPFACHALQLDGEVYLIPPGADFTESSNEQRFKNSVSDQCLALSDVVSEITKLMDDAMHELAASSSVFVKDCRCIFILDTCRDQGFTCAGTKPHASITETFLKPKEPTVCNHLFMFSTSQGKCASDGGAREGHSLYTATLLEHLFVPGKRLIDVQTATENALKAINQTPTWHGPSNVQNSVLFENCGPAAASPEDACNSLHEQPGHRRNNERPYDMYFAVQPVPNAVESLCTRLPGQAAPDKLSCLEHHACKRRIQDYLQERQVDGKLKYKVCLSDGDEDSLLKHMRTCGVRCLVWSALGINLLHQSPPLLGQPSLKDSHQQQRLPKPWPTVVIVCMKYGAHRVAEEIHQMGAPIVIAFPIDLCSQRGRPLSDIVCKLLVAVLEERDSITFDTVSSKLQSDGYKQAFKGLGLDPVLFATNGFEEPEFSRHDRGPWPIDSYPGYNDCPDENGWFVNEQMSNLWQHLRSCDLKLLSEVQQTCKENSLVTFSAAKIDRARAVALQVCRHHYYQKHFLGGIYRVSTEAEKTYVNQRIGPNHRVLVWVDMPHTHSTLSALFDSIRKRTKWTANQVAEFEAKLKEQELDTRDELQSLKEAHLERLGDQMSFVVKMGDQMKIVAVIKEFADGQGWALTNAVQTWFNDNEQGNAKVNVMCTCNGDVLHGADIASACHELESTDHDIEVATLHHELRIRPTIKGAASARSLLSLEEASIVADILKTELNEQRPVQALYQDDDGWLRV